MSRLVTKIPLNLEQATIHFEHGELLLKLCEDVNVGSMEIHCTSATITRKGVIVRRSNIPGDPLKPKEDIGPNYMPLTAEEFSLLAAGFAKVQNFWHTDPLPRRHVLAACGCIVDWDNEEQTCNYRHPSHLHHWYYCVEHDVQKPLARFNEEDFDAVIPQGHVLLEDGCVVLWNPEIAVNVHTGDGPHKHQWVACPNHDDRSEQIASFNEADFASEEVQA